MRRYRNLLFYTITIVLFSLCTYLILRQGRTMEHLVPAAELPSASIATQLTQSVSSNITHPLSILLLQIISILTTARLFGYFFKKLKQPTVIGEIIAGIVLGPSFLGYFFPAAAGFLFPAASLVNLQFLSQIGLILFMFVVGMELDLGILKKQAADAVVISHASIIFPFFLGTLLALFIYQDFAPAGISFLSFSLFIGIAMSITAFPVLARIVQERGLTKTALGSMAITCAAADDVTAWCLLAVVIAIVKAGSAMGALVTVVLSIVFIGLMFKLVRPWLQKLSLKRADNGRVGRSITGLFFIVLVCSAYVAELIGIHALFGAFLAGVIMPSDLKLRSHFIEKVEDVSLVLLLPLFFVFTGLRTHIGLLNESHLWVICGWILLVAVAGKFLGSALAARFVRQSWKDSLSIGALMNTRGLMELIVLNIGYDLGILSPEIFAMMVIMALVTTMMTGPLLSLIARLFQQ